jgi:hypothetical protein
MGHSLSQSIHAFASTPNDKKVFMAKWDIKDGFWHMDCAAGEEWNFAYVLPMTDGASTKLVIPSSLQMGWIESPPYFCAASEMRRDIAKWYTKTPVGTLPSHKFLHHTQTTLAYRSLLHNQQPNFTTFHYLIEVYMDNYIDLATATS